MSYNFQFQLTGEMPMLMHCDDIEGADELAAWRKNPANANLSKPGDDRSPPWTWTTYLYSDGDIIGIPNANMMACLGKAACGVKIKGNKTFKSESQAGILLNELYFPIVPAGKDSPIKLADINLPADAIFHDHVGLAKGLGFTLDVRRASVRSAKHIRVRPRFEIGWKAEGTGTVILPEITKSALTSIFELASSRIGLMDWRPSAPKKPGVYGRFSVKLSFK